MSKKESPLLIFPSWVQALGHDQAEFLHQVHYWLKLYAGKKDESHYFDDQWWIYNTYQQWHEQFFWWSVRTIKSIVYDLQEKGVLLTYTKGFDRTLHYTIDYEVLQELVGTLDDVPAPLCQSCTMDSAKVAHSNAKKVARSSLDKDYTNTTLGGEETFADFIHRMLVPD